MKGAGERGLPGAVMTDATCWSNYTRLHSGVIFTQTSDSWGAPRARTARDVAWNYICNRAHHTGLPGKNDSEEGSRRPDSTGESIKRSLLLLK